MVVRTTQIFLLLELGLSIKLRLEGPLDINGFVLQNTSKENTVVILQNEGLVQYQAQLCIGNHFLTVWLDPFFLQAYAHFENTPIQIY